VPLRLLALLLLCTFAAICEAFRLTALSSLANSDVWWHLCTGLWILQHHALPHTGLFSQSSELPWIASSWGYDVLVAAGYGLLGLRAIPVLLMMCRAALALVTFLLARGCRGNFWSAVLLSAIAQYVLADRQPLPLFFTILAFGIELMVLMQARRSGQVRSLFWLPLLFLIWANLHTGFVYGLLLLGLFLVSMIIEQGGQSSSVTWFRNDVPALPMVTVASVTGASILATLLTPYGYWNYAVAFAAFGGPADKYFADLHCMGFRRPQDYTLLLLTMTAFLALGRRRSRSIFSIFLLMGSTALSFHAQRDSWLVTLVSIAVIAGAVSGDEPSDETVLEQDRDAWQWRRTGLATGALAIVVLVMVAWLRIPGSGESLLKTVGRSYPVAAADYIRENHLPQPLFNNYDWGGFLAWYLPEYPASIDGRTDLYGGDAFLRYFKVMNAELPPTEEPALAHARTLVLPRRSLMADAFSTLPPFEVAYRDDVAVVLLKPE
jgi:hypothetical protein